MGIASKEEIKNMNTVEDFRKLRKKIRMEVKKEDDEIMQEFSNVNNFGDLMKLFAKTQRVRHLEGAEITAQDMINFLEITNLNHRFQKLIEVLILNAKDNKKEDAETVAKLKELEEEVKKVSKSRSIFGDISLSLFKSDMTGIGMDG